VIELVSLEGRESNFPHELSGGQQQRVGIARSLAVEPDIWFLDEPFSALDPLFITHDFQEALRIADRMAIMRDGAIVQIGRPVDLILNPADEYVREFTQDVPWETILTAANIAVPAQGNTDNLKRVSATARVETLLPLLASQDSGIAVQDENGGILGIATAQSFAAALATGMTETAEE